VAEEVDRLPTLCVDPGLVREGRLAVETMRAAAASLRSVPAFAILFRYPGSAFAEAEALSGTAVEQCRAVDRLRPELTARYGVEFPPLDLPGP
jgi:hypothetical protein